jgi:hypothetical protein
LRPTTGKETAHGGEPVIFLAWLDGFMLSSRPQSGDRFVRPSFDRSLRIQLNARRSYGYACLFIGHAPCICRRRQHRCSRGHLLGARLGRVQKNYRAHAAAAAGNRAVRLERFGQVTTTPAARQGAPAAQQLKAKLVPLVFSDKSLTEAAANADRTIEVTITDFNTASSTDQTDRSRHVAGSIKVAYRAINNKTKASLDTQTLQVDYDRRFQPAPTPAQTAAAKKSGGMSGVVARGREIMHRTSNTVEQAGGKEIVEEPPTIPELTAKLVEGVAVQVAQRIVLTDEHVEVPLPRGGSLDQAMDLALAKRWGAMLQQLDRMAPLAGDRDAFRLYGMGVANEAMAYTEESTGKRRDLIAAAAQNYKAALKLRPADNVLHDAENRIAGSLAALDVARTATTASSSAHAAAPEAKSGGGDTWDNAAVIDMVKGGFKDPELIEAIRSAKDPAFKVESPRDLLQLKQAGVSDAVVRAMRQRMAAPRR